MHTYYGQVQYEERESGIVKVVFSHINKNVSVAEVNIFISQQRQTYSTTFYGKIIQIIVICED